MYQDEINNYYDDTDVADEWTQDAYDYLINDIVEFQGGFYYCILEHTSDSGKTPLNTTYWLPYTTIGDAFAPSYNSSDIPYVFGNMVYYANAYYTCKKAHISHVDKAPNTTEGAKYWVLCSIYTETFSATGFYHRIMIPIVCYWVTPVINMGDISVKKTLKNLWVRLEKYQNTSVIVSYSTRGIVKQQYDGFFDFSSVDFSRFNFSTDTDPMVVVTNRAERKFMSIQFKIESDDEYQFGLLEILAKYTVNNTYRG